MIIEFIQNHQNWVIGNRIALREEEGNPLINIGVAKVINETTTIIGTGPSDIAPSGTPAKVLVELTRPSDVAAYLAGDAVSNSTSTTTPLTFADVSVANGGGGIASLLKVESNITALANATLRLWFFRDTPASPVADNVPFVITYANSSARCFYADVTFEPLLAGSDSVYGQAIIWNEYVTNASNDLYCLIQTLSAFTPTSGGKIKVGLSVLKLS